MKQHYFPHDYSARNDQKVLQLRYKLGAEGYGVYWMLLETMAEDTTGYIQKDDIGGLSLGYGVAIETLQKTLDVCAQIGLFRQCEHGNYFSERMLFHKENMANFVAAGVKGAEIRWGNRGAITGANPKANANKIKLKNIKEDNTNAPEWVALFDVYRIEAESAAKTLIADSAFVSGRQEFRPNLDIAKSLKKACVDFWGTKAGWEHKKKQCRKKGGGYSAIDWKRTYVNALDQKCNQVWKSSDTVQKQYVGGA
jgi:hypothetical protein